MPWIPSYSEREARAAIGSAHCWADALRALGLKVHGKSLSILRKWAERWEIPTHHLPEYRQVRRAARFTEPDLREAVAASRSWAEALRRLRYKSKGGNWKTLKKYAALWEIDTSHFDPDAARVQGLRRKKRRLSELLVEGSTISSNKLKLRLLANGIKQPLCELCGQGEVWRGKRIALILDHVNGVPDDNRLENLRIACPNCAATFETHCGRKNRRPRREPRDCALCGRRFQPKRKAQRYCSRECGQRVGRRVGTGRRRVSRPPHAELLRLVDELGYLGVARLYGVSDTAIRKWVRYYEREAARAEGRDPDAVEIPTRTWPNRRRGRDAA